MISELEVNYLISIWTGVTKLTLMKYLLKIYSGLSRVKEGGESYI